MLRVFLNKTGYYVVGDKIEIAKSCPPFKHSSNQLYHLYAVLISCLIDLRDCSIKNDDIVIYNDSRIIEEMNGESCLDDICEKSVNYIRRYILPTIPTAVWFRKKSYDWIENKVSNGHDKMLKSHDARKREEKIREIENYIESKRKSIKRNRIENFKRRWIKPRM